MKLWLHKITGRTSVGLLPTDDISKQVLSRLEDGECVQIELTRPRSVSWHRMYFGICAEIGENQDPQRTADSIDAELRIRAGHFEKIFVDGHEVRMPKRIAFAKLSADEWSELWLFLEVAIRETFGNCYIREAA